MRLRLASLIAVLSLAALPRGVPAAEATSPAINAPASVTVERERVLMGTRCSIVLQGDDVAALESAATAAFETIARLEAVASNWRPDSELARFTRASSARSGRAVPVSPDLFDVLDRSTAWCIRTGGAFDATVEPLTRAYDLRGDGRIPGEAERVAASKLVRGADVMLDAEAKTVSLPARGMAFDLGGIAKGWALDRAVGTLRAHGVTRALVNFGGQVYALGAPVGADAWAVEIASPDERGQGVVTLRLKDRSLATSAASEHALQVGGTSINHILDPRTGRPAASWGSASAIAATATDADCASTALYVMGAAMGLAWAKGQPDLEAVMLTPDPSAPGGVRVERSSGPVAALFPAAPALAAQAGDAATPEPSNRELARRLDVLAGEVDDLKIGDAAAPPVESHAGLGPAASKVYGVKRGVSIGGYGEMRYESFRQNADGGTPAGKSARLDFVRAITYVGYKFSDHALFNSEIEFEHASTELSGSVSVEFAYLDFLAKPALNLRAGMLLVPMGFLNELHEPPTFLTSSRPEVERNIVPSTWRANGAGLHGEFANGLSYRAFVTESLRGVADPGAGIEGITAGSGPYEARQNGSESIFDEVAFTGRVEWQGGGARFGASAFTGGTAQNATTTLGEDFTARATIVEAHGEYKNHGLWVRALGARGIVDEAALLNDANGFVGDESVGSRNYGAYLNVGYELMRQLGKGSGLALWPFVQYERYDTQDEVPVGFTKNPANDRKSWTFGAAFYPDPQIVLKADYQNNWTPNGSAVDRLGVSLGYLF